MFRVPETLAESAPVAYLTGMDLSDAASVLSALGHATRLRVFLLLNETGEAGMTQGDIAAAVGVPKNLLSSHLKILKATGLVEDEVKGRFSIFRANPDLFRRAANYALAGFRADQANKF